MSSAPPARALPTRLWSAKCSTMAGKIVKTSIRMPVRRYRSKRPSGGSIVTRPGAWSTTNVTGTRAPVSSSSRSAAGLATTDTHVPTSSPAMVTTRAPMRSWTHSSAGSSRAGARSTRPRRASAPSRDVRPAKATIQRSWWGRAATTVSGPRSLSSTDPGSSRSARSVVSWTTTSPRSPWARVIRPTSSSGDPPPAGPASALTGRSVLELDLDVAAVPGGGGPHDGTDGLGHPAPLADDAAHVGPADPHGHAGQRPALGQLDAHGVAVLDERADQVLEHGPGRGDLGRRGFRVTHDGASADVEVEAAEAGGASPRNSAMAPEISSSLRTVSVGWAPLRSQPTALSLSMRMAEGSGRGS